MWIIWVMMSAYPDKKSASLIPRPKSDTRNAWFCFSNFEIAKKPLNCQTALRKAIAPMKVKLQ